MDFTNSLIDFLRTHEGTILFLLILFIDFIPYLKGSPILLWRGIPDALVSASVTILLGVGLFRNISIRRSRVMARLALISALFYGGLLVSFAFNETIPKKGWVNWIKIPEIQTSKFDAEASSSNLSCRNTPRCS